MRKTKSQPHVRNHQSGFNAQICRVRRRMTRSIARAAGDDLEIHARGKRRSFRRESPDATPDSESTNAHSGHDERTGAARVVATADVEEHAAAGKRVRRCAKLRPDQNARPNDGRARGARRCCLRARTRRRYREHNHRQRNGDARNHLSFTTSIVFGRSDPIVTAIVSSDMICESSKRTSRQLCA